MNLSLEIMRVSPGIVSLFFILLGGNTRAQAPGVSAKEELKDTIVARYNRDDIDGIYQMGGNYFKTFQTKADFSSFLSQIQPAGKILSAELIENQGSAGYFKLHFAKLDLQLTLNAISSKQFFDFGLTDYQFKNIDSLRASLTDNILGNALDSGIDKAVKRYLSDPRTAGLSIGIIKNGNVYFYDYGETAKGTRKVPARNTIYEIGSITKTFTGLLLAQAIREKKLALDDDIRKYLDGSFPNLEFNGQPIRIVTLSNHTSGIPGSPANFEQQSRYDSLNPFANYTLPMLLDALHKLKIDDLPGTKPAYSNAALALLGHILERAYNISYIRMIKKFITGPLKMGSTKIAFAASDSIYFAKAYDENGKPVGYWDWGAFAPAAALRSTTSDMVKYIMANILEKTPAIKFSHRLTSGSADDGISLSWVISKTTDGHAILSHVGGTGGFASSCMVIPELKSGFVILANSGAYMNELSSRMLYLITENRSK